MRVCVTILQVLRFLCVGWGDLQGAEDADVACVQGDLGGVVHQLPVGPRLLVAKPKLCVVLNGHYGAVPCKEGCEGQMAEL